MKKCPRCNSKDILNYGDSVPTKKGYITHFRCMNCNYFFTSKELKKEK